MMYSRIECPNCGNDIVAKGVRGAQKCPWCRRLYKVLIEHKGHKIHWSAEAVEFNDNDAVEICNNNTTD